MSLWLSSAYTPYRELLRTVCRTNVNGRHVGCAVNDCQGLSVCAYMMASAIGQRLIALESLLVYGGAQPGEVAVRLAGVIAVSGVLG